MGEGEQVEQQVALELALKHLPEAASPLWQEPGSVRVLQAEVLGLQLGQEMLHRQPQVQGCNRRGCWG